MLTRTKYIKSLQRTFQLTTRSLSYSQQNVIINPKCTEKNRAFVEDVMSNDFGLYLRFINVNDEKELMKDVEKSFRRTKYEYNHWDGAIVGFRETEKTRWLPQNQAILHETHKVAFQEGGNIMPATHILDLAKDGHINPHTDSIKFCGSTIAGLSLLSNSIMRYKYADDADIFVDVLLPPLSLYVMKDQLRYDFTHEILSSTNSYWNGDLIDRSRRISILSRCT